MAERAARGGFGRADRAGGRQAEPSERRAAWPRRAAAGADSLPGDGASAGGGHGKDGGVDHGWGGCRHHPGHDRLHAAAGAHALGRAPDRRRGDPPPAATAPVARRRRSRGLRRGAGPAAGRSGRDPRASGRDRRRAGGGGLRTGPGGGAALPHRHLARADTIARPTAPPPRSWPGTSPRPSPRPRRRSASATTASCSPIRNRGGSTVDRGLAAAAARPGSCPAVAVFALAALLAGGAGAQDAGPGSGRRTSRRLPSCRRSSPSSRPSARRCWRSWRPPRGGRTPFAS